MGNEAKEPTMERAKVASIMVLFVTSLLIILSGAALGIYSVVNKISFSVMNNKIHGAVWGLVIVFLGVRYLLSVKRLKDRVYQSSSRFSWSNFKREKERKTPSAHS